MPGREESQEPDGNGDAGLAVLRRARLGGAVRLPALRPGDDRRRRTGLAAADLFRHRVSRARRLAVRRADRSRRRDVLHAHRAHVRRPRPDDGPGVRQRPGSRDGLHGQHRRQPRRHRRHGGALVSADAARGVVRDRAGALPVLRPALDAAAGRLRDRDAPRHHAVGAHRCGDDGRIWSPYYKIKYRERPSSNQHQQHRAPADGPDRPGRGRRLLAAAPAESRRRRHAVRGGPGDWRRLGQRRGRRAALRRETCRRGRDRSGDLRTWASGTIPISRTPIPACPCTSTMAAAFLRRTETRATT